VNQYDAEEVIRTAEAMADFQRYNDSKELVRGLAHIFLGAQERMALAVDPDLIEECPSWWMLVSDDLTEFEHRTYFMFAIAGMVMYRLARGDVIEGFAPKLQDPPNDEASRKQLESCWTFAISYARTWMNANAAEVDALLREWTLETLPAKLARARELRRPV
jgi:hypothetical protein